MSNDHAGRRYPTRPMAGVGAVVWDGEHVLLTRRGRPPGKGNWSIPGGLIEVGETAAEAIVREVREECGIDIEVGPVLGLFEPILRDSDGRVQYHYVLIDFLAYYCAGELLAGDDAADASWVTPAELQAYELPPATQEMIDRALTRLDRGARTPLIKGEIFE